MSEDREMITLPSGYMPPDELLAEYVEVAMRDFVYEMLEDDGSYFGTVPGFRGAWANADTLEECRKELAEVLEGWIILGIKRGHPIPVLPSIDLMHKGNIAWCPPLVPSAEET